mgnify:CR=1 FL=1
MLEKTAQKEPGKKPAPSKKPKPQQEVVVQIPLSELHPFPDHPFQVREDASMQETAESVKDTAFSSPRWVDLGRTAAINAQNSIGNFPCAQSDLTVTRQQAGEKILKITVYSKATTSAAICSAVRWFSRSTSSTS